VSGLRALHSLTNRIFAASAVLIVLAVGATAAFVTDRLTRETEAELQRGLAEATRAVERRAESLTVTFTALAQLVADLPRLKAALATGDAPTVQPVLAEYRAVLPDATVVTVTDDRGRVLAQTGDRTEGAAAWPSIPTALQGGVGIAYAPHSNGLLQVISVPVTVGRGAESPAGTLSVGYLLDTELAAEFEALTGSEITFGLAGRIRSSTFPSAAWPAIMPLLTRAGGAPVKIGQADYVTLAVPIGRGASTGRPVGALPMVLVARSRTERLQVLTTIRAVTAVTALAAVLAATVLSYAVARSVTRPLAAITAIMRDVAATGDLTRTIPVRAGFWEDEDARVLASTFNGLIASIARFEREAAVRERLSALGRLSSVIAHEIRNPLMIIQASVRVLRAPGAQPWAVQEAAADIAGEVARLNRLVHEVLDFARPVAYDLQPTDLNDVCRAAAAAARAAEPDVVVELHLTPGIPAILADQERVRGVLLNALTNAAAAVRSVAAAGQPPGSIRLRTTAGSDGAVTITVDDDGPGIAADLLPRVFEPFVTSRRGGTGLGLAIAKNVIDGLGGSITMENRVPRGATLRVVLAPRPGTSGEREADA